MVGRSVRLRTCRHSIAGAGGPRGHVRGAHDGARSIPPSPRRPTPRPPVVRRRRRRRRLYSWEPPQWEPWERSPAGRVWRAIGPARMYVFAPLDAGRLAARSARSHPQLPPRRSPLCTPPAAASASRVLKRVWPGSGRAKEISRARTCTHTHARPTVFPFWETTILAPPQCIYCTRPLLPLFPLFPPSPLPTLASLPQRPRDCGCACQPSRRFGLLATSTSTHPLSLDHSPSWSIVKRLHRASPPSQGGALAAERAAAST